MKNETKIKALATTVKRLELIDALRGIALCGIIFMNISGLMDIPYREEDQHLVDIFDTIFKAKFYPIFSFLFGVGAFIFMDNIKKKKKNPCLFFAKRLIFLLGVGILHSLLQPGEALKVYAIIGIILLPAYSLQPKWNLMVALILLLISCFLVPTYISILGLFYLGFYLGQIAFFYHSKRYKNILIGIFIICTIIAIYGDFLLPKYRPTNYYFKILTFTGIMQSFAYMSILILLYNYVPVIKKCINIFSPMGKMAFTNYIMQTLLIILISNILGLKSNIAYRDTIGICLSILVFQIILSRVWFLYFSYGPLEWLWRKWTYASIKVGNNGINMLFILIVLSITSCENQPNLEISDVPAFDAYYNPKWQKIPRETRQGIAQTVQYLSDIEANPVGFGSSWITPMPAIVYDIKDKSPNAPAYLVASSLLSKTSQFNLIRKKISEISKDNYSEIPLPFGLQNSGTVIIRFLKKDLPNLNDLPNLPLPHLFYNLLPVADLENYYILIVPLDLSDNITTPRKWSLTAVMVHEHFHLVQNNYKIPYSLEQAMEAFPSKNIDYLTLSIIESRLLSEPVTTQLQATQLLQDFSDLRALRDNMAEKFRYYEKQQEYNEGGARYIEDEYLKRRGLPIEHSIAYIEDCKTKIGNIKWGNRLYADGANLLHLLTIAKIDWKEKVSQGIPPSTLINTLFPPATDRAYKVADRYEFQKEKKLAEKCMNNL
ncbi:DUF418 domain-containing protein [Chryseobacterium gossypii]|uniref:DUF418 domain-containing protein n=1 Tax=Chryseobacterium gossypii TaxID=3231602 RepID=UPI0035255871